MHKDAQTVHKAPIYSVDNIKGVNKRLFKKFLQVIEELVDEYGYIAFDKVTVRRIREKVGISERTFWKYVDVLIKVGLLQYIDKGLYRYAVGKPPWSILSLHPHVQPLKRTRIVEPTVISPSTLRKAFKVLFERIRVHNFRISFSLRYNHKDTVIEDNIGTINIQGNTLQLYLNEYESEDILEGLEYFSRTILKYPKLINYLVEKYKYYIDDISHVYAEISFVYRDDIIIPVDYNVKFDFDYYWIAYKRDKSTGKWELELVISVDADNIEKAIECINFMNTKILWDVIFYTVEIQRDVKSDTEEIKQMLKQILEKLEKYEKK